MNNDEKYNIFFFIMIIIAFSFGIFVGRQYTNPIYSNGTFVQNGTDEYTFLNDKGWYQKQVNEYFYVKQILVGNYCLSQGYANGWVTDVSINIFRIQCCPIYNQENPYDFGCVNYYIPITNSTLIIPKST